MFPILTTVHGALPTALSPAQRKAVRGLRKELEERFASPAFRGLALEARHAARQTLLANFSGGVRALLTPQQFEEWTKTSSKATAAPAAPAVSCTSGFDKYTAGAVAPHASCPTLSIDDEPAHALVYGGCRVVLPPRACVAPVPRGYTPPPHERRLLAPAVGGIYWPRCMPPRGEDRTASDSTLGHSLPLTHASSHATHPERRPTASALRRRRTEQLG